MNDETEKYGWREGEREAVEAEMAERQRQIDKAETLAWCEARDEPRYDRTPRRLFWNSP